MNARQISHGQVARPDASRFATRRPQRCVAEQLESRTLFTVVWVSAVDPNGGEPGYTPWGVGVGDPISFGVTSGTHVQGFRLSGRARFGGAEPDYTVGGAGYSGVTFDPSTGRGTVQLQPTGSASVPVTPTHDTRYEGPEGVTIELEAPPAGHTLGTSIARATIADNDPVTPPSGLTATAESATSIRLAWSNAIDATYNIYRGATAGFVPGSGNRIASGVRGTTYSDRFLTPGTQYYFKVAARTSTGGESPMSNEANATAAATPALALTVDGTTADGQYVSLNTDHDEMNRDANGAALNDNEANGDPAQGPAGHRIVAGDDELVDAAVTINAPGVTGRWTMTFPSHLKVWQVFTDGTAPRDIVSGADSDSLTVGGSPTVLQFKVEGMRLSKAPNDVTLRAAFQPSSDNVPVEDQQRLTVSSVDVDVDSNNNAGFTLPDLDDKREGEIEQDPSQPGKYVGVNNDDSDGDGIEDLADGLNRDGVAGNADDATAAEALTPMLLKVNRPFDLSVARLRFVYAGDDPLDGSVTGKLRIWARDRQSTRDGRSAAAGGDYLAPGDYTAAQVGIDAGTRVAKLRLEGVAASTTETERTIELHVDPDGPSGPEGFELFDDTRLTVLDRMPSGLAAVAGANTVTLDWADGPIDLTRGYRVYRSTAAGFTPSAGTLVTATPVTASTFVDAPPAGGTYYYKVTAVDPAGTNSKASAEVSGATGIGGGGTLPVVTIEATDATAGEAGPDAATLRVTRTGPTTANLIVSFARTDGTVVAADYTLSPTNQVTIPAGSASATFSLTPTDDALVEGSEFATFSVSPDSAYAVGAPDDATVTIQDNDGTPGDPGGGSGPGITAYRWSAQPILVPEDAVPEAVEATQGVQLFRNGNNSRHALARVRLTRNPDAGLEYRVTRSSKNVNVWSNPDRTGGLLTQSTGNEAAFTFTGNTGEVWIDWDQGATDETPVTLSLQSRPGGAGGWSGVDDVTARPTRRMVIGFGGHTQASKADNDDDGAQDGIAGVLDPTSGIAQIQRKLVDAGYQTSVFAEDPGNNGPIDYTTGHDFCGDGVHGRPGAPENYRFERGAFSVVIDAVTNWGVTDLGLFGYSHGASAVRLLTHRLQEWWGAYWPVRLRFAGYIDAVRLPRHNELFDNDANGAPDIELGLGSKHWPGDWPVPIFANMEYDEEEYRYPHHAEYFANVYQRATTEEDSFALDLRGGDVDAKWRDTEPLDDTPFTGAEFQVNINDLDDRTDAYFTSPQYAVDQNEMVLDNGADLEHIEHSGGGKGTGRLETGADADRDRAIDEHAIAQGFITYHLNEAFNRP